MSLVARLAGVEPTDTCAGFVAAADERLWDGITLAVASEGRNTAAIYMLGYVVEMLLKAAYFRFNGNSDTQDLHPALRGVPRHARWHGRNLHDLVGWANLLIDERAASGRALDPRTAGLLLVHAQTMDAHWRETLRYQ